MLSNYCAIAVEMSGKARDLALSGEDVRSNDTRPGIATLMHAAEKATNEIIRLLPLCGELPDSSKPDDGVLKILFMEPPAPPTTDGD